MSTGQFLPVQQQGTTQYQSFEGANLINRRFVDLKVASIDHVSVINKRMIEEDIQSSVQGQMRSLRGALSDADLKVTFSLPHQVQESQLAACICEEVGAFSKNFCVKIGLISSSSDIYTSSQVPRSEPKKFAVVIPLVRGLTAQKPLVDRFCDMFGKNVLHVLINFYGYPQGLMQNVPMIQEQYCVWRIRLVVDQLNNQICCTSVNCYPIDVNRIKEDAKCLTSWLWSLPSKLTGWMKGPGQKYLPTGMQQQQQQPLYSSGMQQPSTSMMGQSLSGQQQPLSSQQPLSGQQQPLSSQQQPLQQQRMSTQQSYQQQMPSEPVYHPGGAY